MVAGDADKFPYEITAISGELFPGDVLIARVKARAYFEEPEQWLTSEYGKLQGLRTPASTGIIDEVVRHFFSLTVADRNVEARRFSTHGYFAMKVNLPCQSLNETRDENWRLREAVSLLVGAPNTAELGQYVVDAVSSMNEPLNQKAEAELLLMNRQGALYLLPQAGYTSPHQSRFEKLADMAVIALYAQEFLTDSTNLSSRYPAFSRFIGQKLSEIITSPALVFKSSYSNRLAWENFSESLMLRDHLVEWQTSASVSAGKPASLTTAPSLRNDWWEFDNLGQLLEDGHSSPQSSLSFIQPVDLREFITSDWQEAKRCLVAGNYRASIVMAGAAVEGLLLATLIDDQRAVSSSTYRAGLQQLIEACCPGFNDGSRQFTTRPHRLISTETANMINGACRPWRNFIHPGVAVRSSTDASVEMANASVSALELLISELRKRAGSIPLSGATPSASTARLSNP
jgi:hypothetical protein